MFLFQSSILLFGIVLVFGQADDYYYSGQEGYDDPLRKTLGLLGRVLNRMAQKDPPTDEQLHFQITDPPDIRALSSVLQQQRKGADRIVSEELLQRLIPRIKGETLPPRTSTATTVKPSTKKATEKITKTTTTRPTTTTAKPTTIAVTTTPTRTTKKVETMKGKKEKDKSSLTVRVKSLQEMAKNLPLSAELDDEDIKQAHIIAEALRILLNQEGMNVTKAQEKLKEMAEISVSSQTVEMVSTTNAPTTTTTVEPEKEAESTTKTTTEEVEETEESVEDVSENQTEEEDENEDEEEIERGEDETNQESEFTTETTTEENKSTTTLRPISQKKVNLNIPEAEEEESSSSSEKIPISFQETGSQSTTTSTPSGQTVYNLNANANSASDPALSNVFTPVNAIVDGIGPLILPLIGYSRQALTSYMPQARGVSNYQPTDGKPVQLRTIQTYTPDSTWNSEIAKARGEKIQQLRNSSPIDVRKASNSELLQAFQRSAQNNPALQQALQRYQASQVQRNTQNQSPSQPINRPFARYIPNPSSQSAPSQANQEHLSTVSRLQENERLGIIRSALIQEKIAQMRARKTQEVIGSTFKKEPSYYGPQLDRHIGQSAFLSETRQRQPSSTQPLPVDPNPDPAYAQGLQKVSAFVGDSGVLMNDAMQDSNQQSITPGSFKPPSGFTSNGFGGGRRPNVSFEEVEKNTEENISFFG